MAASTDLPVTFDGERTPEAPRSRNLLAACFTHALHDGYTDGLYAFLPVWQAQFGLSYAALALVRALYYGTMGGLQIPADRALRGVSARSALILATVIAAMAMKVCLRFMWISNVLRDQGQPNRQRAVRCHLVQRRERMRTTPPLGGLSGCTP